MKLPLIIVLSFLFSLCQAQIGAKVKSSSSGYTGEWINKDFGYEMKLILNSGGKGSFDNDPMSYIISGNSLTINLGGQSTKYTCQMTDNNTLMLTGGDLQAPVKFIRSGSNNVMQSTQSAQTSTTSQGLIGTWTGAGEVLEYRTDGTMNYNGNILPYSFTDNTITVQTQKGVVNFQYTINEGNLMLSSNGQTFMYARKGLPGNQGISKVPQVSDSNSGIIGTWVGPGEELEYRTDGTMMYNGNLLYYTSTNNTITVKTQKGDVNFQYSLMGGQLLLSSNGQSFTYTRKDASGNPINSQVPQNSNTTAQGVIAQELVGKWCYINVSSSNYGGSSTEECVTLYENGTYEYYSERSMSATGYNSYGNQTFTGGTAGQSSDKGTWRVQGNNIIVNSQTQGQIIYQFAKQNHPKTGDPMLVINGRTFVTYYQKPPWR